MSFLWWRSKNETVATPVDEDYPLPVRDIPPTDLTLRTNLRYVSTNAQRDGGFFYRGPLTAVDKLATPATPTLAAITESGSNLANIAYNVTVAAANRWGATAAPAVAAITPGNLQAVRVSAFTVTGADFYDFFLSVDAAPKWVGRATAAQITAGGFIISAVGSVTAGGGAPANQIDLGIVGTQVASTAQPFSNNNAYTPTTVAQIIDCSNWSRLHLYVKGTVAAGTAGSTSVPALSVIPFFQPAVLAGSSDWFMGQLQNLNLLASNGQALEQDFMVAVDGAKNVVFLIDNISTSVTANLWAERV